jgi:hypothetical protein
MWMERTSMGVFNSSASLKWNEPMKWKIMQKIYPRASPMPSPLERSMHTSRSLHPLSSTLALLVVATAGATAAVSCSSSTPPDEDDPGLVMLKQGVHVRD